MAFSKKTEFSAKDQKVADFAKAMAHPARIAILRTLAKKGSCICGEIVEILPLAQSTVSKHLQDLKDAGIIMGEVKGPKSCYCINWKALKDVFGTFGGILTDLEKQHEKNCC